MSRALMNLQEWYKSNCNSDWEHNFGCRIGTLDNPGWYVEIDTEGTPMEGQSFEEIDASDRDDADWILCRLEGGTFKGFGGPQNLEELIEEFFKWVDASDRPGRRKGAKKRCQEP